MEVEGLDGATASLGFFLVVGLLIFGCLQDGQLCAEVPRWECDPVFEESEVGRFPKSWGYPKSSILVGFFIINNLFGSTTIYGNPRVP